MYTTQHISTIGIGLDQKEFSKNGMTKTGGMVQVVTKGNLNKNGEITLSGGV